MFWPYPIDWAATGSMLAGWGAFANAAAVAFAAYKASQWLEQQRDKRRFELAERILEIAYLAEDAFQAIRSPMATAGDVQRARVSLGLPKIEDAFVRNQSGDERRQETAQVILDRMSDHAELWQRFFEVLPTDRAFFGVPVSDKIRELLKVRQSIYAAAHVYGTTQDLNPDSASKFEATFWTDWGESAFGKDEIGDQIAGAVSSLEASLLPRLGTR